LPEFSKELVGGVRLAYLDPPFNLQRSFLHYDDALEHSIWLTMMRDRLEQIRPLLDPASGSVWVHCDDSEMAYLKVVMDEVFGRSKFVAAVVWQKRYSRDNRPAIGTVHDYILVYATDPGVWKQRRNRVPRESDNNYRNPNTDPRGDWRAIPMDAQGFRKNQMYPIETPSGKVVHPPKGRCWSMLEEKFLELKAEGRIYFGKRGNAMPGVIRYLSETEGLVPWTWWPHTEAGHNDEAKKEILGLFPEVEAFDTPKPERLMRRILAVATDPDEIVLDCFLGSGTTAAVAHKMGRRWIGVEFRHAIVETFAAPRLQKVIEGADPGGVTGVVGWEGGGGVRVLNVAPSMFTEVGGRVLLADWASAGALAEATAAQLDFSYEVDAPFCGRRGRMRLAVVDGLVSAEVVRLLIGALPEDERVTVCGTAIGADAAAELQKLRRGSKVRKIPHSILQDYQRSGGWWRTGRSKKIRPAKDSPDEPGEAVA
jgi:adenine-specific DNA-methyltransferase